MIAIKNFKMPSNCENCPFFTENYMTGEKYCTACDELVNERYRSERSDNCPLVEIKEN